VKAMSEPLDENKDAHQEVEKEEKKSKFFAVKVTRGQELNVAMMIENRAKREGIPLYSIVGPFRPGGFLVLETPMASFADRLIRDIRHARRRVKGMLSPNEIELMIKPKPTIEAFAPGMEIEVIAGPLKGSRGKIVDVIKSRNEVVLTIYEASYPLKVTVPAEYIKPVSSSGGG